MALYVMEVWTYGCFLLMIPLFSLCLQNKQLLLNFMVWRPSNILCRLDHVQIAVGHLDIFEVEFTDASQIYISVMALCA